MISRTGESEHERDRRDDDVEETATHLGRTGLA